MATERIKFTRLIFDIEDELTQCTILWDATDPVLCGFGAKRSFPKEVKIDAIVASINTGILVDPKWAILR